MTSFEVLEHLLPCQHIRDHPHGTRNRQEVVLKLCIKQYIPLSNLSPQEGDVTIIAAGGSGIPKEVYEPLWDHLLHLSFKNNFRIRGIWIADMASQGASGVLNEYDVGDDRTGTYHAVVLETADKHPASWFDHSRDLLHMINHFRDQMPRPLIGIGHSIGPGQLVHLSTMHPRLLSTVILIEPVISPYHPPGPSFAISSTFRQDLWPSRESAERAIRDTSFFKYWDPNVLDLYLKYGLRPLPTALYPDAPTTSASDSNAQETHHATTNSQASCDDKLSTNIEAHVPWQTDGSSTTEASPNPTTANTQERHTTAALPITPNVSNPVTLTTTKHQAAWTTLRSNFTPSLSLSPSREPLIYAEIHPSPRTNFLFHQPGAILSHTLLPTLRPPVLYIFGSRSTSSDPQSITKKMCTTGTGMGGSGGAVKGKVEKRVFKGRGHFLPMEHGGVELVGEECAKWIGRSVEEVRGEDEWWKRYESGRSDNGEGWKVSEKWKRLVRGKADARREGAPVGGEEWMRIRTRTAGAKL